MILLTGMFLCLGNYSYEKELIFSGSEIKQVQKKKAIDFIYLYSEWVGKLAYNWKAENTSTDKAIKFTVRFTIGNPAFNNFYINKLTLEPGEVKTLGRKSDIQMTSVSARVVGARFIN